MQKQQRPSHPAGIITKCPELIGVLDPVFLSAFWTVWADERCWRHVARSTHYGRLVLGDLGLLSHVARFNMACAHPNHPVSLAWLASLVRDVGFYEMASRIETLDEIIPQRTICDHCHHPLAAPLGKYAMYCSQCGQHQGRRVFVSPPEPSSSPQPRTREQEMENEFQVFVNGLKIF
jgi:hypothetical protein